MVHLPIADKPEQRAVFMLPAGLAFAVAPGPRGHGAVVSRVDPDPHSGDNDSFREWQLSVGTQSETDPLEPALTTGFGVLATLGAPNEHHRYHCRDFRWPAVYRRQAHAPPPC